MAIYPDLDTHPNFAELSKNILEFWQKESVFEKSVETRPKQVDCKNNEFIFFDGPPFANGLPHYGHLLTGFVKDAIARFRTIKGWRVERRFGWDCHGLPAEMAAEKELKISGKQQIEEYGVAKFNDYCRESVMKYASEWKDYITKQARWVDFDNSYKTMDLSYMESVLWCFKQLYLKGLIYESVRVMPYSWACQTPLSNFETRMDNSYREVADKAVTVKFKLTQVPEALKSRFLKCYLLAWTTTPWTLPSNLALAVGGDMEYSCVPDSSTPKALNDEPSCLIIATSALPAYAQALGLEKDALPKFDVLLGRELEGLTYEPLFSYFANTPEAFKILVGDFVKEGSGTGIVHIAPGFGEDDLALCERHSIKPVCPVDDEGKFTSEVPDFAGMQVLNTNDKIILKLKQKNSWVKTEQILHSYPHCWRTDTPLIYRAVSSWYVKVTDIKEQMVANNQHINWIPQHIRDGLFGKWLEGARDWSISRNRFWGTPIPIWKSDDATYPRIDVYGSIAEIEADFGVKITDLHKQFLDGLVRANPDDPTGKSRMRRIPDVFDCWFESGSMPFAQLHYPFENKEHFEKHQSADFIVEYVGQTRGWFYTLIVLSTALFNKPPFLNCICHGLILDETGKKLSKRLGNYVDPMKIFEEVGSDALRFLMCSSPVMRGHELLIDKKGEMVEEVIRSVMKPIWNACYFFILYANVDEVRAQLITDSPSLNDQYILAKLRETSERVDEVLDKYDLPQACEAVQNFFEVLNNWYIRRNRNRFWKSDKDEDKFQAHCTLYTALCHMCVIASPLLPLLTEYLYAHLRNGGKFAAETSVHLAQYPDLSAVPYRVDLIRDMDKVREVCTVALHIRNEANLRIRQPLKKLTVIGEQVLALKPHLKLISEELNVKEVDLSSNLKTYAKFVLKLNFEQIGKRIPERVKDIVLNFKKGQWKKTNSGNIQIAEEELLPTEASLTLEPIVKFSKALPSGDMVVVLDTEIDEMLALEGVARDLVRGIQTSRKHAEFDVADRINLRIWVADNERIAKACEHFEDYIKAHTLAFEITYGTISSKYSFQDNFNVDRSVVTVGMNIANSKAEQTTAKV
jgi:isoleucyl-tRNA synthetase